MSAPQTLVVDGGRVLLQPCSLYKRHMTAVIEHHHVCPKSWWLAAGTCP